MYCQISIRLIACAIASVVAATSATGFAAEPDGKAASIPKVGDKAPEFTLKDLAGNAVTLSELQKKSTVVLVVLRGYPGYQCPICSIQIGSLMGKAKELKAANARVVLVYPGPADQLEERAREFTTSKTLPEGFYFVTDPGYRFTEAYGLRWDAPRETAYPSTFVIDPQGTVRFAVVSKTHGGRANIADVLNALSAAK